MHYYLAMTSKCNLLCKYCYGKTTEDYLSESEKKQYDLNLPTEMNYSIDDLKNFAKSDKDFNLTFYGGEPLIKIDEICKIMDTIPAKKFMLQTNGILLHKLPTKYINKLHTILVSLDGTPTHTNERRGKLVYEKVVKNLNLIKQNGFSGELIARMTVDEYSDVNFNVRYLLENEKFKFNSVHWQLDAQFWRADYFERDFNTWVNLKYNPKVDELINWWIKKLELGIFHRIYPFVGIVESLLTKEKSPLKCGSGFSLLGIQTNGKVTACPITAGYKPFYMGDIKESNLDDINKNKMYPENTCTNCEILDICGGRCLYANKTKLWGEKGFNEVCSTIFFLVNCLKKKLPLIEKLIAKKIIKRHDFDYEKYNGCEIIP